MTVLTRASKDTAKYTSAFELPYIDTSNEAWYAKLLSFAWENGIVGGSGDHTFKLERHVKRTEMAKLIYSFMLFNDNPAIRDYAQSLKEYYDLPDFKVKPGQVVQPVKQTGPLTDANNVEKPLNTTKSREIIETTTGTTVTETKPTDTSQEPASSGAESPIESFRDSAKPQENSPDATGQTSSLPFTRKSS